MGFSEYLSDYMKVHKVSLSELSKKTGIDRAALHRYSHNGRMPGNVKTVEMIASVLQMSVDEQSRFIEEFEKATMGEHVVNSYNYVCELLNDLKNANDFLSPKSLPEGSYTPFTYNSEEAIILKSSQEICSCILELFGAVAHSDCTGRRVGLIMQPTYSAVQSLLLPVFGNYDAEVEQIICLEKSISKGYVNLEFLKDLLPLCFGLSNYEVYYDYDSLSSRFNSTSVLPNKIISDNSIVLFDYEMQSGIFLRNPVEVKYYNEQFESLRSKCRPLIDKGIRMEYICDLSKEFKIPCVESNLDGRALFRQPCVAASLTSEMLEKCIYDIPGRDIFIEKMKIENGEWVGDKHIQPEVVNCHIVDYATKQGVIEIMKTGKVCEFPEPLHRPLSEEYRVEILKHMIQLMGDGVITYRFLKTNLDLPPRIQFYWFLQKQCIVFRCVKSSEVSQITINESSIYSAFLDFINYMEQKELIYTAEESLEWLKELYKEILEKGI